MNEPEHFCDNACVLEIVCAKKDDLISKLREALKGCLPTLDYDLHKKEEAYANHSFGSLRSRLGDMIDETKAQIAEIRALLGEDARKEGL